VSSLMHANRLNNGANMFLGCFGHACPLSMFPFHPSGHPGQDETNEVWGVAHVLDEPDEASGGMCGRRRGDGLFGVPTADL
jgi:hypothetical protein